mmetsp:Transcript_65342/g.181700  ORF Transcript_65342/g.181700 Transcript_65342/m.181700 type:complete len:672 (+) Transcript_65342:1074-3089(+)
MVLLEDLCRPQVFHNRPLLEAWRPPNGHSAHCCHRIFAQTNVDEAIFQVFQEARVGVSDTLFPWQNPALLFVHNDLRRWQGVALADVLYSFDQNCFLRINALCLDLFPLLQARPQPKNFPGELGDFLGKQGAEEVQFRQSVENHCVSLLVALLYGADVQAPDGRFFRVLRDQCSQAVHSRHPLHRLSLVPFLAPVDAFCALCSLLVHRRPLLEQRRQPRQPGLQLVYDVRFEARRTQAAPAILAEPPRDVPPVVLQVFWQSFRERCGQKVDSLHQLRLPHQQHVRRPRCGQAVQLGHGFRLQGALQKLKPNLFERHGVVVLLLFRLAEGPITQLGPTLRRLPLWPTLDDPLERVHGRPSPRALILRLGAGGIGPKVLRRRVHVVTHLRVALLVARKVPIGQMLRLRLVLLLLRSGTPRLEQLRPPTQLLDCLRYGGLEPPRDEPVAQHIQHGRRVVLLLHVLISFLPLGANASCDLLLPLRRRLLVERKGRFDPFLTRDRPPHPIPLGPLYHASFCCLLNLRLANIFRGVDGFRGYRNFRLRALGKPPFAAKADTDATALTHRHCCLHARPALVRVRGVPLFTHRLWVDVPLICRHVILGFLLGLQQLLLDETDLFEEPGAPLLQLRGQTRSFRRRAFFSAAAHVVQTSAETPSKMPLLATAVSLNVRNRN